MAYNKITSHFSSSETFSEDRYFSYDNVAGKAGFVKFIDFADSTSTSITGSGNNIFFTGSLDLLNDLTASKIILNENEIKFENQDNYFLKKNNNSISINSNLELTGTVNVLETHAISGLTGSLIYTDQNNTKLLNKIKGIDINIENDPTGLPRWILSQASQESNVGITQIFTNMTSPQNSLIVTGSTTIDYYRTIDQSSRPVATNRNIIFSNFTDEHKSYISSGKFHIFVLNTTDDISQGIFFRLYPTFGSDNQFSQDQIGSKYLFMIGDYNNSSYTKHNFSIYLPDNSTFIDSGQNTKLDILGIGILPKIGINFYLKCLNTDIWSFDDGH